MKNETQILRRQVEDLQTEVLRLQQELKASQQRSAHFQEEDAHLVSGTATAFGESEERLRIANEAARIGTYITNLEADKVYWSPELCNILGVPPGTERTNEEAFKVVHDDDLERVLAVGRLGLDPEGDGCFCSEHRVVRPDGQVRWILWRGRTIFRETDSGRIPSKRIGACVDITERKQAEEALSQSEEKFRLAFSTSPDSINFNRFSDGVYIDINEGFTKLTGYTREDVIGKSSIDLNIWYDLKDRKRLVKSLQKEGYVGNLEAKFRRKDGQVGVGLMSARVLRLDQEDVILSITRDITERKQVEDALRESEDKYNQLVESLPDAILVWSGDHIIYANPAALRLFKANYAGDLIGKRYLDLVHPDDRPESVERIKKSKNEKWIAPRREHRMITEDGKVIYVESTGVPIQIQGQVLHLGIFSNISKRKRAEEELRLDDQRMEALLQLNQMTHASMQEIASFAMEEAVRLTQSRIGYLAFANEDESVLTMYAWSRSAMKECAIEQKPLVYQVATTGLWGETVRQRKAIITNDYQAPIPLKKGFPKGHVNVERHLGVPIFDNDRIVIVAGVGDKGSDYNERDIKQLELLMSGMWRIVQKKQAEDALRHSEARFRTAFENASVGITLVSIDGIYLEVNEAFARIIGYSPEDLIGKSVVNFTHPDDLDRRSGFLSDLISGRVSSGEQKRRLIHRNGSYVWILIGASVQRNSDGNPMYFISLVQDITARKLSDEKLRETEKKYRELAESLPQVIFEIDLNGTLKYVNKTAHQLFGYTPEEIANGFNVLNVFIPEDRERVALNIMRNVQGEKIGRQDYTAVRKDGTKFPVGAHASPVMSGQTATGIRGILIDLTATQQAKEEKKKLEIQLQQAQKMEAIGSLAGGIAHDFNNILSAIIGYTELAMLNEDAEHCKVELKEALIAANRAKDLVKQILAFSRQTDEERMPVRVALVAKEAVKFLRATIPATIEIKTRLDEKSGAVLANSVELHQIIMNLCTNAQHAIGEQPGLLEVEVQNTEIDLDQKNEVIDLEIGSYVRTFR